MTSISAPSLVPPTARPVAPMPQTSQLRTTTPDLAKVAKAAQDFEAMAIGQLLQPMFDTVDTAHGAFGGGDGEAAWKPMLVQEIAKKIAAGGGLGLARPVYDAMLKMQEKESK